MFIKCKLCHVWAFHSSNHCHCLTCFTNFKLWRLLLLMTIILHGSSPSVRVGDPVQIGGKSWSAINMTFVGCRIWVWYLDTPLMPTMRFFHSKHVQQFKICQATWRPWSALRRSSSPNDPPSGPRVNLGGQHTFSHSHIWKHHTDDAK